MLFYLKKASLKSLNIMIKNLLPLFTFLFSFFLNAQSNTIKVEYIASLDNKEFLERIVNSAEFTKEAKKFRLKHSQLKTPVRFKLFYNNNEGLFKIGSKDTIKTPGYFNETESASRGDRLYYSNAITKEQFWISDKITPGAFIHLEKIDWEFTSETKRIGDYICHKAIAIMDKDQPSGNEYLEPVEAWYTKEIPTSFGILKFHGLPGLTMELSYNRIHHGRVTFLVDQIDLNSKDEMVIQKPRGIRDMTEREYVTLINRLQAERVLSRLQNK